MLVICHYDAIENKVNEIINIKPSKPMDHGLDYGIEFDNSECIEVESNFDANEVIETTAENQENSLPEKK